MKRRALVAAVLTAVLAAYAAVSLWPYQWQVREQVVNGAEPLPDGGIRFRTPGIASTEAAPAWVPVAMHSDRLEISLEVRSLAPRQFGPARILTLSLDPYRRNLMVGQDGADLILRLRTAWTDANGQINGAPVARVPKLFLANDWVDLHVLLDNEPALAFYRGFGFVEIGRVEDYFRIEGRSIGDVQMTLRL